MDNLINKEKLENLLIRNWAEFLDLKTMFALVSRHGTQLLQDIDLMVYKMQMSRFELVENGFIVWVDYKMEATDNRSVNHKLTSEFLLTSTQIIHRQTILNDADSLHATTSIVVDSPVFQ